MERQPQGAAETACVGGRLFRAALPAALPGRQATPWVPPRHPYGPRHRPHRHRAGQSDECETSPRGKGGECPAFPLLAHLPRTVCDAQCSGLSPFFLKPSTKGLLTSVGTASRCWQALQKHSRSLSKRRAATRALTLAKRSALLTADGAGRSLLAEVGEGLRSLAQERCLPGHATAPSSGLLLLALHRTEEEPLVLTKGNLTLHPLSHEIVPFHAKMLLPG